MDPAFAAKVVVVSASGALAPGPLTASTAALGARGGWRAGFSVAVGHTLVELPLVAAIAYGVGSALSSPLTRALLGAVGGAFMVLFAVLTLKAAAGGGLEAGGSGRFSSALATGAALSLFNPFFIMWWLGVGSPLIAEAVERGARGLLEFYAAHVWIDYAWLSLVAGLGSVTRLNGRAYRALLAALALLMLYFGASTALTAASWLAG